MLKVVERRVLALKVDWEEFHERLEYDAECDGTTTDVERILAELGLTKEAIEDCVLYFDAAGGHCDCEIALNVDMTDPKPLRPCSRCRDCGNDFDEYSYIVHDRVWGASGLSKNGGLLCVGCLEARIGRRLCRDDFSDAPINRLDRRQSLRLQNRING